jgi:hypothetical protein
MFPSKAFSPPPMLDSWKVAKSQGPTAPEIPMKSYWMGRDIESLSREELIEVVRQIGRALESARSITNMILKVNDLACS